MFCWKSGLVNNSRIEWILSLRGYIHHEYRMAISLCNKSIISGNGQYVGKGSSLIFWNVECENYRDLWVSFCSIYKWSMPGQFDRLLVEHDFRHQQSACCAGDVLQIICHKKIIRRGLKRFLGDVMHAVHTRHLTFAQTKSRKKTLKYETKPLGRPLSCI